MATEADNVDKLFYNRYWVHVEERAFHTTEQLEFFGYQGESTPEAALEALGRLREVRINIPTLAKFYSEGYKLKMSNILDCREIFHIINNHLREWLVLCQERGYVNPIPPIEDFELLDRLAEKFFPYRENITLAQRFDPFFNPIEEVKEYDIINLAGVYEPYTPKLFPYCEQVYGVQ